MYRVEVKHTDNANKFRQAAICFQKNGYYTPHPKGTTAFLKYWEEESRRCLDGFTSEDGEWISGYFYFYLNYSPIILVQGEEGSKRAKRVRTFPDFWDYDRAFFDAVEEAEKQGKHLTFLKPRGIGNSFKGASMLARNYFLIPDSKSFAVTEETEHLTKDGILTKAFEITDFVNEHTAWSKKAQKVNTKFHKRASFVVNNGSSEMEVGYKSEIIGFSVKNDPDKGRGKRGKLCIIDEVGLISSPVHLYSTLRHGFEEDGVSFGLIILSGTGGTQDADFSELRQLFYEPKVNNFLEVENIWDEGKQGTACGFFWPRDYCVRGFMDSNGNSDTVGARKRELEEREKIVLHASDRNQIDRYCAERPLCVDGETWMSSSEYPIIRIKDNPNSIFIGEKECFKLTTKNNRILNCTDDHPIYNGKEYIKLKDLKVGDNVKISPVIFNKEYQKINIKTSLNITDFTITIDEEWAKFIGLYMGDGSFYKNSLEIIFDKKDESSLNWAIDFVKSKFKSIYQVTEHGAKGGAWRLRVTCKDFNNIFYQLGFLERTEKNLKRKVNVPEYIIKSPKSVVSAFLSGIFDSDGHITKNNSKRIGLFSKYEDFLRDIIILLSGFEIYPSYSKSDKINGEGRYFFGRRLEFGGRYIDIFKKEIRFISDRKNALLDSHITRKIRTDVDRTLDEIISISSIGLREVYDITTESHYFSANSIWVHNCPNESLLQISMNIFPKKELLNHLSYLQTHESLRKFKQVGDLEFAPSGELMWTQATRPKDITKYRLRADDSKEGQIVIWEHPIENPPFGLYIMGCDPYDHDQASTSESLGSCFVYKRFQSFEKYYDLPVAEYTGRPSTVEEFYEIVRKLAIYYKAKILYENEKKGLYIHFAHKHCEYILADQPDIIKDIMQVSRVERGKGIHMNKFIKQYGELRLRDWLNEEYEPGKKNLTKILSEPLLEELIEYNPEGNADRVIAMLLIMIYREELFHVTVTETKKDNKKHLLFPDGLFGNSNKGNDLLTNLLKDAPVYRPWR